MIKVYVLPAPIDPLTNTQVVYGIAYIHDALLSYGHNQAVLIQDTTPEEHTLLAVMAIEVREPTPQELEAFNVLEPPPPPDPDILKLAELLARSPEAITMPDMWKALRLLGKLHGIPS